MNKKTSSGILDDFEESNWMNLDFRDVLETFTYSEQFHLSPKGGSSIAGDVFDRNPREGTDDMIGTPRIGA
jgi:hypothetical protein